MLLGSNESKSPICLNGVILIIGVRYHNVSETRFSNKN